MTLLIFPPLSLWFWAMILQFVIASPFSIMAQKKALLQDIGSSIMSLNASIASGFKPSRTKIVIYSPFLIMLKMTYKYYINLIKNQLFFLVILFFWIFIDLFTKKLANLYLQEKINLISDFLYLQYVENTWIAFSIQLPSLFLKLITIILIIWIFYYYRKELKTESSKLIKTLNISFWLILAGAIGNWIERVFYWRVIDFIGIKYFSVFNLADSFIIIWAILYLWFLSKQKKIN